MRTNPMTQGQGSMSLYRADRSNMDTLMGVRAPRHRLSERSENWTRDISSPIQPLDAGTFAKTLVKVVQMTMCIFVMDALLPPTLLPAVGYAWDRTARCMSSWGDQTNASVGYANIYWTIAEYNEWREKNHWILCMRSWLNMKNIMSCERFADSMNEHGERFIRLKHQLAFQEPAANGFITRDYPELEVVFGENMIRLGGIRNNKTNLHIFKIRRNECLPVKHKGQCWFVLRYFYIPDSESIPTNICAEQAAQAESSSLAGYVTTAASIATSLMTYALNATIIEPDQEERPDYFRLKMIGICVLGGAATLCASAWAVFYAIKKRSRATALATATESVSLKTLQETA